MNLIDLLEIIPNDEYFILRDERNICVKYECTNQKFDVSIAMAKSKVKRIFVGDSEESKGILIIEIDYKG